MSLSKAELKGLFSTGDGKWRTPRELFIRLDGIFHYDLDAAADSEDALCERYIDEETNALMVPWQPARAIWLNPPFGDGLYDWMIKVVIEAQHESRPVVTVLLPVRTETNWGQFILAHSRMVLFFDKRIRYVHPDPERSQRSPGFPSMLCVVHKWAGRNAWKQQLGKLGQVKE